MQSKLPYIKDMAHEYKAKFIALTETHLRPDVLDSEIQLPGYTVNRSDRLNRSHGGVLLYIRNDVTSTILRSHSDQYCSTLIVKDNRANLVIIVIYKPPDCPTDSFRTALAHATQILSEQQNPSPDILKGLRTMDN